MQPWNPEQQQNTNKQQQKTHFLYCGMPFWKTLLSLEGIIPTAIESSPVGYQWPPDYALNSYILTQIPSVTCSIADLGSEGLSESLRTCIISNNFPNDDPAAN